jgi:hypothetical protein
MTDDARKRVVVEEQPPPDRTPAQMRAILTRIVNRDVEALRLASKDGALKLGDEWQSEVDRAIERVDKLERAERMSDALPDFSKLNNEQLLALKNDRKQEPSA